MVCGKCGCDKVMITTEQTEGKTKTKHKGLLYKICRSILIFCSLGLWLFVPKKKETSKTKYKTKTVAICQKCGHKWEV